MRVGTGRIFNGWSLDGIDVTEYKQGSTMVSPNVDVLQECEVESSNMSAEYEHKPNRVNTTVKGVSNQLHGDAFELARNDVFGAANSFFVPLLEECQ